MTCRVRGIGFWFAITTIAFLGCRASEDGPQDAERQEAPADELAAVRSTYAPPALAYLEAAVDTLEAHHILGPTFDWEELRLATLERAEGAQTPEETHEAIRWALGDVGEKHGYFMAPLPDTEATGTPAEDEGAAQVPLATLELRRDMALITVPSFWDPTGRGSQSYATQLQNLVKQADAAGVCGWIVDVRGNRGGNMWAMLAGLGPLLGEGNVGAFVGREGTTGSWTYETGKARLNETIHAEAVDPYEVGQTNPPVAVLTDRGQAVQVKL
jgi:carboxyl-terminal processing protease